MGHPVRVRLPLVAGAAIMPGISSATWSWQARGGPDEASWTQASVSGQAIPIGTWVDLYQGGEKVWWGQISEQSDHTAGTWHAVGHSRVLDRTPAVHSDGDMRPTSILAPVLDRCVTRGQITGYDGPAISPWAGTHVVDEPLGTTVGDVLDRAMADAGMRWWVDDERRVTWEDRASIPVSAWVRADQVRWGSSTQETANAVYVAYRNAGVTTWMIVRDDSYDSAPIADRFVTLDLTGRGNLSPADAQSAARKRLSRPALVDALTLTADNTTTPGQTPMPGRMLRAGDVVRVWIRDGLDGSARPAVDTMLQASRHSAASSTIEADPDGKPARGVQTLADLARGRYADPLKIRKR